MLIPTTCGTGSEGNGFAVLTNPENGDKKSLRCNAIVAKVSIVDPDCMKTMPKHVLAAVGFDALCHCMEAYIEASYKGDHFKFAKIARIFGGITADDLAPKIRTLLKNLDLDVKLSDLGIEEKDIPWMAENCMKVSAASIANNPVVFTQEEIAEIYKKAM